MVRGYVIKSGADLRYANLRDADLRYANLRYADLRYANLRGADLRDADLRDADLRYANLRGADLRGANLCDASLGRADLRDADLRGAVLRRADLRRVRLDRVRLDRADLRGADLRYVRGHWQSHAVIAEVLRQAARDDPERRAFAGLVIMSLDWCWISWVGIATEYPRVGAWAAGILRDSIVEGDETVPKELSAWGA